jgi:hypothetical protein
LERLEDRTSPSTNTWTGAADHATWNLAGNWSAGIPAPGQDVVIPATGVNGTTAVTLSGTSANIDSLTSALPVNVQGVVLACAGGGTQTTGGLTLTGGAEVTLTAAGIVDFQSTSQTLGGDGTGAIVFGDTNPFNEVLASAALQLTVSAGFSIHGTSGKLGGPGSFVNNGLIEAQNGGTILLDGAHVSGTGTIQAGDGTTAGTININFASCSGNTLTTLSGGTILAGGSTLTDIAISSGSTVTVQDGATTILEGTITNNGTIAENLAGNSTAIEIAGLATLAGGGTLTMSNFVTNQIISQGGPATLTNVDNTIQGAGQIGVGSFPNPLVLVNQAHGTIDANRSKTLTIDLGGSAIELTNTGLIEASGGGQLSVIFAGIFNAGGTILATDAGSVANLMSPGIFGGTLTTTNGGTMFIGGSELNGSSGAVTISSGSTVTVQDGTTAFLQGTITNNGTIAENSAGNITAIEILLGNATLTGGGTLTMSNFVTNQIIGQGASATLTNVDNTIEGAGEIGANTNLSLVNKTQGTIDANQSQSLRIDPTTTANDSNAGLLEASGGGSLGVVQAQLDNTGGTIIATGSGSVVNLGVLSSIVGGTLTTSNGGDMFANGCDIDAVTISSGSTLTIPDGAGVGLAGTITNHGTIALNSAGKTTAIVVGGLSSFIANATLTGGGALTMSNFASNRIVGPSVIGVTLTNVDNTILGAGEIGANTNLSLVNKTQGIIDANQSQSLRIDPTTTANDSNAGLLEASGGGSLGVVQAQLDNTGGTILATGSGSVVTLGVSSSIVGGTLTTSNGGAMFATGCTIDAVTITSGSTLTIPDGASAGLAGTITNHGTIALNSAGKTTTIVVGGLSPGFVPDVTLTGGGSLAMSNFTGDRIEGPSFFSSMLINVNNTIQGAGEIGAGTALNLDNQAQGSIDANQSNPLLIDPAGANISNEGTFEVQNGSGLSVHGATGDFTNFNQVTATLTGGTYLVAGTFQFLGAHIVTSAANITLDGPSSKIVNQTGGDGLINFAANAAAASFTVKDGQSFMTFPPGGAFTNAGAMTIDGSGGDSNFIVAGSYTQTGGTTTLISDGTASLTALTNAVNIQGGTMQGTGTVSGNVTVSNGAALSPGTSTAAGIIAISGSLAMSTGSILSEKLTGPHTTTPIAGTDYDQVSAGGTVTLTNPTLSGSRFTGYLPAVGSAFKIIDNTGAGAVAGTFNGLPEGGTVTIGAFQLRITYQGGDGNDVVLTNLTTPPATVTAVAVDWGTQTMPLQDASGGRLLPAGRNNDMPWVNISAITITLSQAAALSPGDISLIGIAVGSYGPVVVSGSGTSYTITLHQAISKADRVTLSIGNAGIATFTRRLDVLPGDDDDSGAVTLNDGVQIINNTTPAHAYAPFRDLNGDGKVDLNDFTAFRPYLATPYLPPTAPQLAADGEGPGAATRLSPDQLQASLAKGVALWSAAGISAQDVGLLRGVTARVADLPPGYLGYTAIGGKTIYISADAAGYGWSTSPAAPKEDLLTVVMHELGHCLGLGDLASSLFPNDLMAETLPAGVARLPSALDVADANALGLMEVAKPAGKAGPSIPSRAVLADLVSAVFSTHGTESLRSCRLTAPDLAELSVEAFTKSSARSQK